MFFLFLCMNTVLDCILPGAIPLNMSLFENMIKNEVNQEPGSLKVDIPIRIIYSMKVRTFLCFDEKKYVHHDML